MIKELNKSIDLPLEEQYKENWGWENSYQRYEIDSKFLDKEYFENMDPEELCHLVRKLDNFLRERGISDYFISNFDKANQAFRKLDEKDDENPDAYSYV